MPSNVMMRFSERFLLKAPAPAIHSFNKRWKRCSSTRRIPWINPNTATFKPERCLAAPLSRGVAPGKTATERRDYSRHRWHSKTGSVAVLPAPQNFIEFR